MPEKNTGQPLLHFMMNLPANPAQRLIVGKLFYRDLDGQVVEYRASSSYPGAQIYGTYHLLHHPIPPGEYTVDTAPIDLSKTRGVRGPFFRIRPFACLKPYEKRGDFGIHWDADAEGSNGCLVFRKKEQWANFQYEMKSLHLLGISHVKLIVEYAKK